MQCSSISNVPKVYIIDVDFVSLYLLRWSYAWNWFADIFCLWILYLCSYTDLYSISHYPFCVSLCIVKIKKKKNPSMNIKKHIVQYINMTCLLYMNETDTVAWLSKYSSFIFSFLNKQLCTILQVIIFLDLILSL